MDTDGHIIDTTESGIGLANRNRRDTNNPPASSRSLFQKWVVDKITGGAVIFMPSYKDGQDLSYMSEFTNSVGSKLLFNSRPLMADRDLVSIIGLEKALIVQQIHYWLEINSQVGRFMFDGCYWTRNTFEQLLKEFDFFSLRSMKRYISELEDTGIIISTQKHNKISTNRTKWYTIDYRILSELHRIWRMEKQAKQAENSEKIPLNADEY